MTLQSASNSTFLFLVEDFADSSTLVETGDQGFVSRVYSRFDEALHMVSCQKLFWEFVAFCFATV
jgi:hypothetical protein